MFSNSATEHAMTVTITVVNAGSALTTVMLPTINRDVTHDVTVFVDCIVDFVHFDFNLGLLTLEGRR